MSLLETLGSASWVTRLLTHNWKLSRILKICNDDIAVKAGMSSHYKCLEFNSTVLRKMQAFSTCQTCYDLKPNAT